MRVGLVNVDPCLPPPKIDWSSSIFGEVAEGRWGQGHLLRVHFGDVDVDADGGLCLHNLRILRNIYRRPGQVERGSAEEGKGAISLFSKVEL